MKKTYSEMHTESTKSAIDSGREKTKSQLRNKSFELGTVLSSGNSLVYDMVTKAIEPGHAGIEIFS